jgi:Domain of unknown function (DUF3402)
MATSLAFDDLFDNADRVHKVAHAVEQKQEKVRSTVAKHSRRTSSISSASRGHTRKPSTSTGGAGHHRRRSSMASSAGDSKSQTRNRRQSSGSAVVVKVAPDAPNAPLAAAVDEDTKFWQAQIHARDVLSLFFLTIYVNRRGKSFAAQMDQLKINGKPFLTFMLDLLGHEHASYLPIKKIVALVRWYIQVRLGELPSKMEHVMSLMTQQRKETEDATATDAASNPADSSDSGTTQSDAGISATTSATASDVPLPLGMVPNYYDNYLEPDEYTRCHSKRIRDAVKDYSDQFCPMFVKPQPASPVHSPFGTQELSRSGVIPSRVLSPGVGSTHTDPLVRAEESPATDGTGDGMSDIRPRPPIFAFSAIGTMPTAVNESLELLSTYVYPQPMHIDDTSDPLFQDIRRHSGMPPASSNTTADDTLKNGVDNLALGGASRVLLTSPSTLDTVSSASKCAEFLYQTLVPDFTSHVKALLRVLLTTAPTLNPRSILDLRVGCSLGNSTQSPIPDIELRRHREILLRHVSYIFLRLLKSWKHHNYWQLASFRAVLQQQNAILIFLKVLSQNMKKSVMKSSDIPSLKNGMLEPENLKQPKRKLNVLIQYASTQPCISNRKCVGYVNLLRAIQKIVKRQDLHLSAMSRYSAHNIMRRITRTVFNPEIRIYALKILKSMMPFIPTRWRELSQNMRIISDIFHNVRMDLIDDWLEVREFNEFSKKEMLDMLQAERKRITEFNQKYYVPVDNIDLENEITYTSGGAQFRPLRDPNVDSDDEMDVFDETYRMWSDMTIPAHQASSYDFFLNSELRYADPTYSMLSGLDLLALLHLGADEYTATA